MLFYHIIILALIQGITEFLPISSSGHLVLFHEFITTNNDIYRNENFMMDVAVHVGTLFSVLLYFRNDVYTMFCGLNNIITGNKNNADIRLILYVFISSLPVVIAGFIFYKFAPVWLRSIEVIAWTTLIFGIILWWVDKIKPVERTIKTLNVWDALWIGCAQILALIPGVSRSGITMTAARWFGFTRTESARYSLLLAIISISGAGVLNGIDLLKINDSALTFDVFIAAFLAFISGFIAISIMMRWLERASFALFAAYRVILGLGLLGIIYSGVIL